MKNAVQIEHRASSSRSKHEGESSFGLCDRLSRTRDNSQRQLPTDQDYAVSTREYQTDQSSLKTAPAAARSVLDERPKRRQQQTHRLRRLTRSLHIRPNHSARCSVRLRQSLRVISRPFGSAPALGNDDRSVLKHQLGESRTMGLSINPLGFIPDIHLFRFELGRWGQRKRSLGRSNRLLRRRFRRRDGYRRGRFYLHSRNQFRQHPLDKLRLLVSLLRQRKAHWNDPVLLLDEAAQRLQASDFGSHDERLGDDLQRERLLAPQQSHAARLLQPLDLDLADGIGDPFRGAGFGGLEEHLGRRQRKHRLGVLAVALFHLAAPLKSQHRSEERR